MKLFFRLFGICLLLGCAPVVWSQTAGLKVDRVDIKYVGPASVSEQFIRSNIRLKAGDFIRPAPPSRTFAISMPRASFTISAWVWIRPAMAA